MMEICRPVRGTWSLRVGRRPPLLGETDLLPLPGGVPEAGDDDKLVAVLFGACRPVVMALLLVLCRRR